MDPDHIVTCGEDRKVVRMNWRQGTVVDEWRGHASVVNSVICGAKGHTFSGARDTTICQWTPGQTGPLQRFGGHEFTVQAIAVDEKEACTYPSVRPT